MKLFSVMVVVTALGVAVAAQRAQFDVASVKLCATMYTRCFLIRSAFQLHDDQIVGGPNWLVNSTTDTVEVLVIDALEHPTPN